MEPFGIAAGVGVLVVVGVIAMVAIAVGWWALRRTLSMLRKLIVLGVLLALVAGTVAAGVSLAVALQFDGETEEPGLHPPRSGKK